MNLLTISTESWLDNHCARWVRFAKKSNPGAILHLVCISDKADILEHPVVKVFDCVKVYTEKDNCRDFYNTVRMGATKIFGVGEMVYCDCDADILQDLSGVPGLSEKRCCYCLSPTTNGEWDNYCKERQIEGWMANNGFLVMRGDMSFEYGEAMEEVKGSGMSERMRGTYAFNLMIRKHAESCFRLPERISEIWWDAEKMMDSRIIQYCNGKGQAKQMALEKEWRDCFVA